MPFTPIERQTYLNLFPEGAPTAAFPLLVGQLSMSCAFDARDTEDGRVGLMMTCDFAFHEFDLRGDAESPFDHTLHEAFYFVAPEYVEPIEILKFVEATFRAEDKARNAPAHP
jgi:hypothetical protein